MIRAYCLLGAAAVIVNGPTLAPLVAMYRDAPAAERPAPPPRPMQSAFAVEAQKGQDGLFRVTGVAGVADRRPVRFVVDTGATVTVLSARDAARLDLSPGSADSVGTLRTASGAAAMVWKHIDRLEVGGSRLADIDVVVLEGGPDHSLLGQDVLARLGTVTMTGTRLEIKPPTRRPGIADDG